jgi:hypothetical protein
MTKFTLRFPLDAISYWSARYSYPGEAAIANELAPAARARGYLTHAELVQLGRWKSPRIGPRIAANAPAYVEAVTATALSAPSEQLRIEVLTLLYGVGWPMASVILHWCHVAPYPILDFRALWSLGLDPLPPYDFPLWQAYTDHCRALAADAGVSMRTLDRALWQYSKENQ